MVDQVMMLRAFFIFILAGVGVLIVFGIRLVIRRNWISRVSDATIIAYLIYAVSLFFKYGDL